MKTRDQIYSQEASTLLRNITMYRRMKTKQLILLFPGKEDKIQNLLTYLKKQGRICYDEATDCYCAGPNEQTDKSLLLALWVLVDFGEAVEFHSVSDFPAKLIFFAGGEVYEVIYIPSGQETLISQACLQMKDEDAPPRRLILVDCCEQIPEISIPGCCGYCTVDEGGRVSYFKKE